MSTSKTASSSKGNSGGAGSSDRPPAYDTISISPPSVNQDSAPTSSSRDPPTQQASARRESSSSKWKQKWQEIKEEDERRKAERIRYVSPEEADRITGLDRHRAKEEKKSAERKRGGKSILGMLMLS